MSQNCDDNCSSCGVDCPERRPLSDFLEKPHPLSRIKKVIGVISGKGGVGKTLVTSLLAAEMNRRGFLTGVMDCDITGPSIPKAFGLKKKATGNDEGIFPVISKNGVKIISINLLLANDTDPVIWRGPIIAGTVKQFWTGVIWRELDFLFIDMPPGTGDVPLTVFQSIPIDGLVVVTSPQELVSMVVTKAVKMAEMMKIPLLGIVENMSYFRCPDCGRDHQIFGDSHIDEIAQQHHLKLLGKIPMDPALAAACDLGTVEEIQGDWLSEAADTLKKIADASKQSRWKLRI